MSNPNDEFPRWTHDEDLLDVVRADGCGRCRVTRWPTVEIVLGRGGKASREIDLIAAAREGVPILRRRGGGCAVVLDPGNLVISAIVPMPGLGEVTRAFRTFTAWLCEGVTAAGVEGLTSDGVSDLVLGDRKIGGSCIYRTRGLVYYTTTLLISPDLARIERLLLHPPREPSYRRGRSHSVFLASLSVMDPESFAAKLAPILHRALPVFI